MADEGKSDIIDVSEAGKLRSELLKDETVPGIHQFVAEQYEKQVSFYLSDCVMAVN